MNFHSAVTWVEKNPVYAGAGIFVIGLGLMYVFGFFGSSGSNSSGADAYFAAQAATAQSGNDLAIAQTNNAAAEAIAKIQGDVSTANNTTWANADLAQTESNNQAATSGFPFAVEESALSALGSIASLPPTTTVKKSSGFLGIGGGTKITSTPSPIAITAAQELSNFANGFIPGH